MFQGNILNSEQVDNRHFNTVYKDIDTVHELITNKAYGSPTVLGKTEAYGCSMEQGENNVYESLKEPSAYEISGDVAMNLYDNNWFSNLSCIMADPSMITLTYCNKYLC